MLGIVTTITIVSGIVMMLVDSLILVAVFGIIFVISSMILIQLLYEYHEHSYLD